MSLNLSQSPKAAGFQQPAEWAKHDAVWLAWPSHGELWEENLRAAQDEFIALCEAIADLDPKSGALRGEKLKILVPTDAARAQAQTELLHLKPEFYLIPFGDIWLRDTAPIFLKKGSELASASFRFNGWGEKYSLPHDTEVSARIAHESGLPTFKRPFVLEGGSVEVDGEGTCLTSKQCLLNQNRNPGLTQTQIENELCEGLGVSKVLWLGDGLLNDHTDGHIDTMARLVGPGKTLCMIAKTEDDPNREVLQTMANDLSQMVDAKGRRLQVGLIPSPGAVLDDDGEVMPASYMNFYIGNTTVVVPTYGSPEDHVAVAEIAKWFPKHRTVGRSAKAILSGGGAFHCISQQQPSKES